MEKTGNRPLTMAFYGPGGFVPAYKQAVAFAGDDGQVATLPDIIVARCKTDVNAVAWTRYFTTMSAEYVGLSKGGSPIVIVAHNCGPMATLDGILKAYGFQFNDKTGNTRGGRITNAEFHALESGKYGDVDVIDLEAEWRLRDYTFSGHAVTSLEIKRDPLMQARLGFAWRDYVGRHENFARAWERKRGEANLRPCIMSIEDANGAHYSTEIIFNHWMKKSPGHALAHLLSIGQLMTDHHQYDSPETGRCENRTSLACDTSCHGWNDGVRLAAMRADEATDIHPGFDFDKVLRERPEALFRPNPGGSRKETGGMHHLIQRGKRFFAERPKQGDCMDTGTAKYPVGKMERINGRSTAFRDQEVFRTTIGGYHGFVKYGLREVFRMAPPGANAYTLGEFEIESVNGNPTHHVAPITFYKAEIDNSQRVLTPEEVYRSYDLMLALTE